MAPHNNDIETNSCVKEIIDDLINTVINIPNDVIKNTNVDEYTDKERLVDEDINRYSIVEIIPKTRRKSKTNQLEEEIINL